VRGDVGIRAFGKRHRLRRIELRLRSLGPSRLDRDELRQLGVILGKLTEECVDSAA